MNPLKPVKHVAEAIVFPFKALAIFFMCLGINWMTSPHHWWVQWVALGLVIAMVVKFAKALKALIVGGALAALAYALHRWWQGRKRSTPAI
jgi:hypothetical protein